KKALKGGISELLREIRLDPPPDVKKFHSNDRIVDLKDTNSTQNTSLKNSTHSFDNLEKTDAITVHSPKLISWAQKIISQAHLAENQYGTPIEYHGNALDLHCDKVLNILNEPFVGKSIAKFAREKTNSSERRLQIGQAF
ncbi:hypothetical protein HAX54_010875, partial [Datura stramonium]|nr:hypothetical protein [Datura stramonium]